MHVMTSNCPKQSMLSSLEVLKNECKDLYILPEVPVHKGAPTALNFLRKWVSPNKPVIFRNVLSDWPALQLWNSDYLRKKIGNHIITVAVTPTGYADAAYGKYFVMPEERQMTFNSFLDIMEDKTPSSGIHYVQKQNSNFLDEFQDLLSDIKPDIQWASEAFGKIPDAVNFWMGDKRAVTSMHRDHYENIYCVIKGQKDFILLPPTDLPWVPYENFKAAVFMENNGKFQLIEDEVKGLVPWIPLDPEDPDLNKYPQYRNASPVHCSLKKGDILYLPSLWFHHVRQSHGCIAVNYWYDMEFDIKYCYYKFLESVVSEENKSKEDKNNTKKSSVAS